jgi:hypothetical protein
MPLRGRTAWLLGIFKSEAVFASCLFVVELLGCCLSFKSEAVFRKRISQLDGVDRNCSALALSVLLVRTSSRAAEL